MLTGGAGGRAMTRAFEDLFAIPDAFRRHSIGGPHRRVDSVRRGRGSRHSGDSRALRAFRAAYLRHLADELHAARAAQRRHAGRRVRCSTRSSERDDVYLALLTGNYEEGARLKLEYFDLWRYFPCGAFGDDAPERNGLLPKALARDRSVRRPGGAAADAIVIGDTPLDVGVRGGGGARSIAVATGSSHERTSCARPGADVVLRGPRAIRRGADVRWSGLEQLTSNLRSVGMLGRACVRQPSIRRTSPARGPFCDSSGVNSTR